MTKQINLEEETKNGNLIGILKEKLIKAGAQSINFADYLILDEKIYEPTKWKKERKEGQITTIPTHYRERHKPMPRTNEI